VTALAAGILAWLALVWTWLWVITLPRRWTAYVTGTSYQSLCDFIKERLK